MRIAFVGLPLAALLLARDGHEIVWAGVCRKDAIGVRRLRRVVGKDRVAMLPDLARAASTVRALSPDLVVSWFWTKKVPASFRTLAPLGAIGVHPSLLPRHRGPDPYFWAIDAGDAETGVTAHLLDEAYDTGAILRARAIAINPSWNAWTLAKKLDRPSLALLRETVRAFAAGELPRGVKQDETRATEAPAPTDDELEISWDWEAARIERRVRAASPWPGACTTLGAEPRDRVVTLTKVRVTQDYPKVLEPGDAFVRNDGVAIVRAADAAIELLGGRVEDDGPEADEALDAPGLAKLVNMALEAST